MMALENPAERQKWVWKKGHQSQMNCRIRRRICSCQIKFKIASIELFHASWYYHNAFNLPSWLHFQRVRESSPGTTGLEEAWEVEHVRAPALLPPHSSNLGHPWWWRPQPQHQDSIRVNIQMATEPTAPETLVLERTCHGEQQRTSITSSTPF